MQTDTDIDNDRSIESLIDWSKWLISINSFAATGCIVALKAAEVKEKVGKFFFIAIVSFAFSVICSTLFVFLLSNRKAKKANNAPAPFIWLAILQWALFAVGLVFVLAWIAVLSKVISI